MERVYAALSISLITNKRFTIYCDNAIESTAHFIEDILQPCGFNDEQYTIIDLLEYKNIEDILHQSTILNTNGDLEFKNTVIWQNLQQLDQLRQKQLYKFILQVENYNKNLSSCDSQSVTITSNGSSFNVVKPLIFTIIPFLEYNLYNNKIYPYLKEMFWSSVTIPPVTTTYNEFVHFVPEYKSTILQLRSKIDMVYVNPTIKSYIYSLIVFIRCHRLASLAPKSVRVPTATITYVEDFCKSSVLWRRQLQSNRISMTDTTVATTSNDENENVLQKTATAAADLELEQESELFVTPEYVKIAIKIVGYWLVDWETNRKFANTEDLKLDENDDITLKKTLDNKKLEISMLTGDWYGSEYYCANELLKGYKAKRDVKSPTGMTNRIVDDAIEEVRPPM
ncbi:hypothetical protein I9W82_001664 [Candida metapsilosis]|uniref:Uncharacterized protein n=1 Tax=Candida metapsilosis TaxID=273372 RepID=A0A8H7ZFU6_9ASCO|nr:hypothetical protein I9W82_001664 [Candida metapsilosis]